MSDDHTSAESSPFADDESRARPESVYQTLEEVAEARRRIGEASAETVIINHAVGLYELASIHLTAEPPRLSEAALAIDAVACLVEGLGQRLGQDHETLVAALQNIRMAFVQVKQASPGSTRQ